MPDVNADPDKLRQFARTLSNSALQFEQLSRQLQRSLDTTGWKDSERQRFEQDFKQTLKAVTQVAERLRGQYVPQINKKAEALDRFRS
ncbi:MAG: WXG100 family type VII secretion target [Actinomycetota bacterium]|nr:WXG100 family type VII secretion target [Actinomycetota bacterium]